MPYRLITATHQTAAKSVPGICTSITSRPEHRLIRHTWVTLVFAERADEIPPRLDESAQKVSCLKLPILRMRMTVDHTGNSFSCTQQSMFQSDDLPSSEARSKAKQPNGCLNHPWRPNLKNRCSFGNFFPPKSNNTHLAHPANLTQVIQSEILVILIEEFPLIEESSQFV